MQFRSLFVLLILAFKVNALCVLKTNLPKIIIADAGISAITSPSTGGCYNTTQSVVVTIQNFGTTVISNIPVNVYVTGPLNQTISSSYAPAIGVGASVSFTVGIVNMNFGGVYTFTATTNLPGDGNPNNDFSITTRTVSPVINIVGPLNICLGNTVTLNATGGNTYTWSTGPNTTSISVSPTITSTYSVAGTNTAGCTAIQIITLSVTDPTISATGTAACGNPANGTLTATAFTPAILNWYATPVSTVVLGTGNNFSVSTVTTTTYYAEAASTFSNSLFTTLAGGNSSFGNMFDVQSVGTVTLSGLKMHFNSLTTSTVEVWYRAGTFVGFETSNAGWTLAYTGTVIPLGGGVLTPIPGTFAITVPAGQIYGIYVTTNGGSGVNYTNGSFLGNLFASNSDLQYYEGKGGSYFNVTSVPRIFNGELIYKKQGCTSPRVPVTFTVATGVTVTAVVSNTAVCEGSSATFTAAGAANYTWSPPFGISPSPNSPIVSASPTAYTTYTVIGSAPGCTAQGSATTNLSVIPGPTLSITPSQTVSPGTILTLTTGGAFTYSWSPGGSNNTTILISPTVTTVYTVTGTNSFGCTASITTTVYVNGVGLNELKMKNEELVLWPNPANAFLIIEGVGEKINYRVYDAIGKEILTGQTQTSSSKLELNTGDLPSGLYFIALKGNERTVSKKFVVAR